MASLNLFRLFSEAVFLTRTSMLWYFLRNLLSSPLFSSTLPFFSLLFSPFSPLPFPSLVFHLSEPFYLLISSLLLRPPSPFGGKAVVAFKLLSRDTRGRVEARQLLVPEEVQCAVLRHKENRNEC